MKILALSVGLALILLGFWLVMRRPTAGIGPIVMGIGVLITGVASWLK